MAVVSFRGINPNDLLQLQAGLDRLLQNPSLGLNLGPSGASVFPPANVFVDRDGDLVIRAEVPGVRPDELQVTVEPRRLTIAGERKPSEQGGSYHRRERSFGRFARTVQLPEDLDSASATAEVRNGVLTVRIAKRAEAKPLQIKVKGS